MVHAAVGFARTRNRLPTFACTASIGPGSTNMVTGAALATINRLPVLLLPGDVFATRVADPVLQELEDPRVATTCRSTTRSARSRASSTGSTGPSSCRRRCSAAMRVLTDPAETGAVTICLPQDVQAEAFDWPDELFARRVWHVARPVPEPAALARAVEVIRAARRPLSSPAAASIYSEATEALRAFAEATGIPVAETQAGKGALPLGPPAVGRRGRRDRHARPPTRWPARPTSSSASAPATATSPRRPAPRSRNPDVRFVNLNVAAFDAAKHVGGRRWSPTPARA